MKDVNILKKASINYEQGVERFAGYSEKYEKYLKKFLDDTQLFDLHNAIDAGDIDNAFVISHTMKGLIGNLSINGPFDYVSQLVEIFRLKTGEDTTQILLKIDEEYDSASKAIREYFR